MLDEAMRLAEEQMAEAENSDTCGCDACAMSRALLSLRPLVAAADGFYDADGNARSGAESRLLHAVHALRGAR